MKAIKTIHCEFDTYFDKRSVGVLEPYYVKDIFYNKPFISYPSTTNVLLEILNQSCSADA